MQHNYLLNGAEQVSAPLPGPFRLVQYNCLGRWNVFLSLFGSFSQLACTPSIVTLQDHPAYRGKLPSSQLFSSLWPSGTGSKKPRVAFYVFSLFLSTVTLLAYFFERLDVMALALFTPEGFVNTSMSSFIFINSYSSKSLCNNP